MDDGLDLTGAGKIAKAIPAESWKKAVDTACDTFSQLISPITKTTAGLGMLIEAKFDSMADIQKVYAADAVKAAKEKVDRSKKKVGLNPKASVIIRSLDNAANETDDNLRDIWANLIANEMIDGLVHPDFPNTLERLSSIDAQFLAKIAEENQNLSIKRAAKLLAISIPVLGVGKSLDILLSGPNSFSTEHLERLGVIRLNDASWKLTLYGEEFLKAVTDPSVLFDCE